jgi:hypothetical protein
MPKRNFSISNDPSFLQNPEDPAAPDACPVHGKARSRGQKTGFSCLIESLAVQNGYADKRGKRAALCR